MDHRIARGPRKPETHGQYAEQDEKRHKFGPAQHALQRSALVFLGSSEIGYHGQFWQVTGVAGYTPVVVGAFTKTTGLRPAQRSYRSPEIPVSFAK